MKKNYDEVSYIETIVEILDANEKKVSKCEKNIKINKIMIICLAIIQIFNIMLVIALLLFGGF